MSYDVDFNMNTDEKNIFKKYKNEFPFKIVEFVNELGIKVSAVEMIDPTVSGAICKEENRYRIYINNSHAPTRLRFTLAHELGHYYNDKKYLDSVSEILDPSKQAQKGTFLFRQTTPDINLEMRKMDVEANKFAAELLMPEEKFIEVWRNETTPEAVAKFFGVSVEAIKIRASIVLGEIF